MRFPSASMLLRASSLFLLLVVLPLLPAIATVSPAPPEAEAQAPPVPPPPPPQYGGEAEEPGGQAQQVGGISVEILTKELTDGKNVVYAKISHGAPMQTVQMSFAHQGRIKTVDMVHDLNDVYKGLADVRPPSSVIVVRAVDTGGNVGSATAWIAVKPSMGAAWDGFLDWLGGILFRR
ncbi:MAG: hypothetical protein AB1753_08350 [Thermoproteota archaeon]